MNEDQIATMVADLLTSQGGYALVAGAILYAGRRIVAHLCKVVPRVLDVAEKIADDGIRVRVELVDPEADGSDDAPE